MPGALRPFSDDRLFNFILFQYLLELVDTLISLTELNKNVT
jgi:hypothetical protein